MAKETYTQQAYHMAKETYTYAYVLSCWIKSHITSFLIWQKRPIHKRPIHMLKRPIRIVVLYKVSHNIFPHRAFIATSPMPFFVLRWILYIVSCCKKSYTTPVHTVPYIVTMPFFGFCVGYCMCCRKSYTTPVHTVPYIVSCCVSSYRMSFHSLYNVFPYCGHILDYSILWLYVILLWLL